MPDLAIDTLVRFARIVSDAERTSEILSLLADALFEHVCHDAVAVMAVDAAGKAKLAAERGLPDTAKAVTTDPDDIGSVGEVLAAACRAAGRTFESQLTRPLIAGGNLFGAVVLLWAPANAADTRTIPLADAFIDLAAISLGTAAHVEQLEKQYAELRASQEMLARTEKLRALGQMAAGVSHDLKNILNPLSLHLHIITRALDRGDTADAKESCAEMKQVLVRGVQTIERLRDFSRQQKESKTELVHLDQLAREAVEIAKPRMAASGGGRLVGFDEELTSPPPVMAVSGEVVSAIVNLVVNAIDAMAGKGGTITLRSGDTGTSSFVEVADDGPDMPPEIAQRVFEPFFTTKGSEGTGLGLAMVYATMQRHGGTVTVDSGAGKGTKFRLSFPHGPASGR